jgi:hypothetical protein
MTQDERYLTLPLRVPVFEPGECDAMPALKPEVEEWCRFTITPGWRVASHPDHVAVLRVKTVADAVAFRLRWADAA